jgi:DeoR family transcriptional regulator, fructose operon transcriptional repressor
MNLSNMFNDESSPLAIKRQTQIREILQREGVVRTAELKELLQVSAVTVRSDLRELEAAGVCKVVWGGAVYVQPIQESDPLHLKERLNVNAEAKRRIGAYAASLVEDGQTIIVDAGSTTVHLIHHLSPEFDYLRIITPALNVAMAAVQFPQFELVMTGGVLRNITHSLIGPHVMRFLEMFNADWAFIASGGFTVEHGVTTSHMLEVEVKKTMIQQASRVALVADSSKYGTVLSLNVAPLTQLDVLVTDTGLPQSAHGAIVRMNVNVACV